MAEKIDISKPTVPPDDPFRKATRIVVEIDRKAFEILKDR